MASQLNRSTLCLFIVVLWFSGSACSRSAEVIESGSNLVEQPNILFIWTDQQIFGMLSCEGNQFIQTPNLDRLAREGALLNNAFCTFPSCSPSRATVVTGLYTHRHRLYDNIHPEKGLEGIKPMDGFKITQQYLLEAGYTVGHRGKWHAGEKADWGKCFTEDSRYSEKYAPLWDELRKPSIEKEFPWDRKTRTGKGGYVKGKLPLPIQQTESWQNAFEQANVPDWAVVGETLVPPDHTMEYTIVDDTIDFIEKHQESPWMVTLSLSPPHDPWDVPEPYYSTIAKPLMKKMEITGNGDPEEQGSSLSWRVGQLVDDQGVRDYMAIYHAQVVMMDDFIGRVLDKLDELQLTDNTLVIFTSDHGDMVGMHRNVGKINNNLYNRLYHVPCLIRYPKSVEAGQIIDKPVMHTDFMPTLLDYAGIEPPRNIDGRSLRPLLEGAEVEWRDCHLLEKFMNTYRNPDHSVKNKADFYWVMGVEDGRYKYLCPRFNDRSHNKRYSPPRFIDLKNDPFEENSLFESPEHQKLVREYHEKLRRILEESRFEFMDEFPEDPWAERSPATI
jgi:arylsulfatase A-like enzyme